MFLVYKNILHQLNVCFYRNIKIKYRDLVTSKSRYKQQFLFVLFNILNLKIIIKKFMSKF